MLIISSKWALDSFPHHINIKVDTEELVMLLPPGKKEEKRNTITIITVILIDSITEESR